MDIKRFYTNKIVGDSAVIDGDEFLHLTKVLRYKKGYNVVLCDGSGFDFLGTIEEIEKSFARVIIEKKELNICETKKTINLCQALSKTDKIDFTVQKAVELGVKNFYLFKSEFSQNYLPNLDRLNRIIKEASKQCGRAVLMNIEYFDNIENLIDTIKNGKMILPYEKENKKMLSVILKQVLTDDIVNAIIGSEGGFSEREVEAFVVNNAECVSLGNRILRTETASIIAVSAIMLSLGEMDR